MFSRVSLLMEFVHALYRMTRFLNGRSSTARRFRMIASTIRVIRSMLLALQSVYAMAVLTVIHLIVYPVKKAGFAWYSPRRKKSAVQNCLSADVNFAQLTIAHTLNNRTAIIRPPVLFTLVARHTK
jgi:heme exporter protein D